MPSIRLLLTLALVACFSLPSAAVDLSQVDRTIGKEPAYKSKPKYCLVVFGPEAKTRVWLVLDGDILYMDRNGNGDLTEEGERLQGAKDKGLWPEDLISEARAFGPVDLARRAGLSRYRRFSVTHTIIKKDFPKELYPTHSQQLARNPNLTWVRVSGYVDDKYRQEGWADWSDRPANAPILHFDGPLAPRMSVPWVLPRRQKPAYLSFGLATPGLGDGKPYTYVSAGTPPVPRKTLAIAEFEFPSKRPGAAPIKVKSLFTGDGYFGRRIRVPGEAGLGKGSVTISFPDSTAGQIVPATFDVTIVDRLPDNPEAGDRRDLKLRDLLQQRLKFVGIDDPQRVLGDVLQALKAEYKLEVRVNQEAFEQDKVTDVLKTKVAAEFPLPRTEGLLAALLRRLLRRIPAESGAVFLIRDDCIEITTERAARAELGLRADRPFPTLVYEEFENEPCADALRTVSLRGGISLAVDPLVEEKAKDACVTARLHNVPAAAAVRVLASMAGLGVAQRDNVFYITTPEKAERLHRRPAHAPESPTPEPPMETKQK